MNPKLYATPTSRGIRALWYAEETGMDLDYQPERPHPPKVQEQVSFDEVVLQKSSISRTPNAI